MSLRSRLIVTFVAVVSLLLGVGLTSYLIQRQMGRQVADLRPSRGVDLKHVDLESTHLEIEGVWDREIFVATDVTVGPGRRRPKLRGEIHSLDFERQTFSLYGVPIRVAPETDFLSHAQGDGNAFARLSVGQRVEVSAQALAGSWTARKVRTYAVKSSDQIKGTPSSASADAKGLQAVDFHGIAVSVAPVGDPSPNGALRQVELATEMTSQLQEARAAAHALVGASPLRRDPDDPSESEVGEAAEWLAEMVEAIEHTIAQSGANSDPSAPLGSGSRSLLALEGALPAYRRHVDELRRLAGVDAEAARAFLQNSFEPFLANEMLVLVYAHRSEAEDALMGQVRRISERARTMTGLVLGGSVLSAGLAIGLGLLAWRSVRAPLGALQHAATRIGRGQLDTRVEIQGPQELEVLARAFNQMAAGLAASTVSVQDLEDVFDSMVGVLVLLDQEGRITGVNRAAEELLGYGPAQLVGEPFTRICPASGVGAPNRDAEVSSEERTFVRANGSEVFVSFSAAELGARDGVRQGHVCVAQDLTDRKLIEERLRATVEEKELLLREVHHRVKNNMQVVSSLLAIHAGYVSDATAVQRFQDCQNQIRSMALIHEQLHRASQPSEVDLPGYLRLLASHLLQSFGGDSGVHLEVDADDVSMGLDSALVCGLIVNELVTNALRHAFDGEKGGKVRVALHQDADGSCVLSVVDDGRGLSREDWPGSGGLGLSLVATLVRQLGGRLRVGSSTGLEVSVLFTPEAGSA